MKKFLAAFLSVMIVMCASVTAFGATKSDVNKVVNTSVAYAFDGKYSQGGYTIANAKNFYILTKSGADVSAYKEAFFASAKDAAHAGTLTDVGTLGEIITIADKLGMNPENIDGVNYVEMLKNADPANYGASPYNYLFAAEAASAHGLTDAADAFCGKMIGFYTIGTGTDFWGGYGTSADDLAMFLITLKYGSGDYSQYTNDAFALLENTYSADGYVNYTPSADSTALALAAYSAYGNKTKADDVYKLLIDKFYDGTTGGFKADYDPYYATADAVLHLHIIFRLQMQIRNRSNRKKPQPKRKPQPNKQHRQRKTQAKIAGNRQHGHCGSISYGSGRSHRSCYFRKEKARGLIF